MAAMIRMIRHHDQQFDQRKTFLFAHFRISFELTLNRKKIM